MNLEIGKQYNVTVVKILSVGAIVELEDKTTELIHISNIANAYIEDVSHFVSVGKEYVATCEEGVNRPIQLTLKPLDLKSQRIVPKKNFRKVQPVCLDTMIDNANASFEEKSARYNKRNRRTN